MKSCLVSREKATSIAGPSGDEDQEAQDLLQPLETAVVQHRARPSLLQPLWRSTGVLLGTGIAALLPAEASVRAKAIVTSAVVERYEDNIRSLLAKKSVSAPEVKKLFKSLRDDPARSAAAAAASAERQAVLAPVSSSLRLACSVSTWV
ncbi:unnamed protein product [Discosporangium mesarthrocarpum]